MLINAHHKSHNFRMYSYSIAAVLGDMISLPLANCHVSSFIQCAVNSYKKKTVWTLHTFQQIDSLSMLFVNFTQLSRCTTGAILVGY